MINEAGIQLLKDFEGLRLQKYRDAAGLWTVGYGHLIKPWEKLDAITEQDAEALLLKDITIAELPMQALVRVTLNENQYAALVCFVFNEGQDAFRRSVLLKQLNLGNYLAAAWEFERWVYCHDPKTGDLIKLDGLVKRRDAEKALFLKPVLVATR